MTTTIVTRADAAVTLRGVSRVYGRGPTAVRAVGSVFLDFPRAAWTAVMGPSGSGKSTLLHCAAGLERVDAGRVLIGDTDITAATDAELTALRRDRIGFVFQGYHLVGALSAEQNVALPLRPARSRAAKAEVRATLVLVGLAERARHRPLELSGGEQQRVAIARALVNDPKLILGDEPTGNLDSSRAAEVLGLLRRFNRERGQTVLIVTHDQEVGAACDRIIRMRDGRIIADERVADVQVAA